MQELRVKSQVLVRSPEFGVHHMHHSPPINT